jgi:hypothetical protein
MVALGDGQALQFCHAYCPVPDTAMSSRIYRPLTSSQRLKVFPSHRSARRSGSALRSSLLLFLCTYDLPLPLTKRDRTSNRHDDRAVFATVRPAADARRRQLTWRRSHPDLQQGGGRRIVCQCRCGTTPARPCASLCCRSLQASKASLTCPPGYRDCIRGVVPHPRHAGLLFHNVSAMLHHITHWHQPGTWPWTWAAAWAQWRPRQLATNDCWYALLAILH